MLIRFSIENFKSFNERQEVTFVATSAKDLPEATVHIEGFSYNLLRVAVIYGANASGKTNVLKALATLRNAVSNSHRRWKPEAKIPIDSFRLGSSADKPSVFEVEFLLSNIRHQYGFSCNVDRFLTEWLYAYPQGKKQVWFERADKSFSFGRNLIGENRAIEALTRQNSLFLSAAAQNNHEMLLPIHNWIANRVQFSFSRTTVGTDDETAALCKDSKHKQLVLDLLKAADLGVTDLRIDEEEIGDRYSKIATAFKETFPELEARFTDKIIHMALLHAGSDKAVELPIVDESAGTIAYFSLLGPVVKALEGGGVLCVDELDSSLHPLLALEVVKLFNDPRRNFSGAQLLFNTHDTNLLDNNVLRRDQIWFTEKDPKGATHLYPLSDFKLRRTENRKRGYLQGRYGAVPFIGEHEFVEAMEKE
jgi:uncharacterized protein